MREVENINQLQELDIDFMGIIKYPKSKRFVDLQQSKRIEKLTMNKGTAGVYVNATIEQILQDVVPLQLDMIQLHGDEDPAFAKALLELDFKIFKAIQITPDFDFASLKIWEELSANYVGKFFFLFDTATKEYGGSGKQFDWDSLTNYKGKTPFLLSGGIGPEDVETVRNFTHEMMLGIDLNSKFESKPGLKNIDELKRFIKEIRA